jgi:hypothetical protein
MEKPTIAIDCELIERLILVLKDADERLNIIGTNGIRDCLKQLTDLIY